MADAREVRGEGEKLEVEVDFDSDADGDVDKEAGVVRGVREDDAEGAVGIGMVCTREMVLLRERGDAYDTEVVEVVGVVVD